MLHYKIASLHVKSFLLQSLVTLINTVYMRHSVPEAPIPHFMVCGNSSIRITSKQFGAKSAIVTKMWVRYIWHSAPHIRPLTESSFDVKIPFTKFPNVSFLLIKIFYYIFNFKVSKFIVFTKLKKKMYTYLLIQSWLLASFRQPS
jgi:hypothetical protein